MKIYAWAVIKVLRIYPKSIEVLVSEIERDKLPHLLEQIIKFGCKEMQECSISSGTDLDNHPIVFGKSEPDKKIKFCKDQEYGVLIVGQGVGPRAQRILKGNSKNLLDRALGRVDVVVRSGLIPYKPRTTKRQAI